MARISTYQLDNDLTKDDKVLGSDSGGATRNFSLEDIAKFISSTNALSTVGCIPYKYNKNELSNGNFKISGSNLTEQAFPTGNNVVIEVSKFPNGSDKDTVNVLNTYVGKDIVISQIDNPNVFALYRVTSVAIKSSGSNFYNITADHVSSSNNTFGVGLSHNLNYNLAPYQGAQDKDFNVSFGTSDLVSENNEYYFNVNHNLGKFPSITVKISTGNIVEAPVKHITKNQSRVYFKGQNSGIVYAN
jgi:hypothetical protein